MNKIFEAIMAERPTRKRFKKRVGKDQTQTEYLEYLMSLEDKLKNKR